MMRPAFNHSRLRHASCLAVLLSASALASPAFADTKAGFDVSLAGKVASNPFNDEHPGSAVVALSPSIDPWLSYQDPDTTVNARGDLLVDQYSDGLGRNTSALASVDARQAMSEHFALRAGVSYADLINSAHDILTGQLPATDITVPTTPGTPLPDVSVAGRQIRTNTVSGHVGADLGLSARDSLSLNVTGGATRSDASGTSDFNTVGGGFSYSRVFSMRTTGMVSVQFNDVDYLHTVQGDGTIISPLVGVVQQLNRRLNLQLNVGVSIANSKIITGGSITSSSFAGNAQLCDRIDQGTMCIRVARTAQPSVLGGISISTEAAFQFDRKMGEFGSLSALVRYARNDQGALTGNFTQDLLGGQVSYSYQFSRRFSAFVTPSYSKIYDSLSPRGGDFELRAGVRYRFGAIQ